MNASLTEILRHAAALRRDGRDVVACLLVSARGSTPQSAGALMLVDDTAATYGTIGGGCVEAEIRQRAFQMLTAGSTGLMRFKLDHDHGWDDGMLCGGTLELAVAPMPDVERLELLIEDVEQRRETVLELHVETSEGSARYVLRAPPRSRLYVAGAGHIGQAVARLGLRLDFDVTLFDDRSDLLDRFAPEGAAKAPGVISERLGAAPIDDGTYCVIATRGHRHDARALQAVVGRGAGYVGMIGSRRKVRVLFEELIERGVDQADLDVVHAPIGLEIGSVTVEEIAVSIVAQLVQERGERGRPIVEAHAPGDASTGRSAPSAGGACG